MTKETARNIINKTTKPNTRERLLEMKYYAKRQIIHNTNFYKGQDFLKEANKQPNKTIKYCNEQLKELNNGTIHRK